MYKLFDEPKLVKTPTGQKKFIGITKNHKNTLKIKTLHREIIVSNTHRFVIDSKNIYANTLNVGDTLQTENGYEKVIEIANGGFRDVYDLLTVDGKVYYTNGILSHNCFLGSADTMISTDALQNIETIEPIHNKYINGLRVYNTPEKGHNYIVSVDPAKDGIDDFSLHVIDVTTLPFKQVAAANLQVDYLSMSQELNSLGTTYNNAFMIIENNEGAGQSINDTLWSTFDYENLYKDRQPDDSKKFKKYKGFRTTTKSRGLILNLLKIFLENDNLIIQDENTVYELQNFVKQDNGKYAADEGFKDDLVMSLCISFAPLMTVKGFENQKAFLNEMFKTEEIEEKNGFDELFNFGVFDDGSNYDELDEYHQSIYDLRNNINNAGEIILKDL